MANAVSNFPFRSWVPRPVGILIILFLFVPVLFINGTYSSNIGEMTSSLGIISENIQYANFATAIGMAVFTPFLRKHLELRRPKMAFILGLLLLTLFSYLCARTDSIPLLIVCSFLTGIVRMDLIFHGISCFFLYVFKRDMVHGMKPAPVAVPEEVVSKIDHFRTLFLSILYLFFLTIGQLGSFVTAYLAYSYEWQYVYYFMIALALISLVLVELTMVYQKRVNTAHLNMKKFGDMVLASLLLMSLCYVLIYGKTLDWFDDRTIRLAVAVFLVSLGGFIFLELYSKRPYFNFRAFTGRNIVIAVVIFLIGMVLNSSSMLVSAFTGLSMTIDNWNNALLSNWSLAGNAIGTVIVFFMAKKRIPFKYMFIFSFSFITVSAIYMYFQFQSMGLYNNMIFPVIIRSAGMIIAYGMAGALGMTRLNLHYYGSWMFIMLTVRSVIGPVAGISLYSNLLDNRENYYINRLSQEVDMLNPQISGAYAYTQAGAMMQGRSYEDAQSLASMSVTRKIHVQAVLAALKEIAGWTIWVGFASIILVIVIPYKRPKLSSGNA